MLNIEYHPNQGCSFRDGEIVDQVRKDWASAERVTRLGGEGHWRGVASELYITALRSLIAQGEIDHTKVSIIYIRGRNDRITLKVNKFGQLEEWPKGFCDVGENLLCGLLNARYGKAEGY